MKDRAKRIVGNGLPYGLVFFALSFILGYFLFRLGLQPTLLESAAIGIAAILANGFLFSRFSKPIGVLDALPFDLDSSEQLVTQAPANHIIDDNQVAGKLFLTHQRMVFKAYGGSEGQVLVWTLSDLKPVDFSGSIWNSGGEFVLQTQDGIALLFEVDRLKPWRDAFQVQQIGSQQEPS